MIGDDFGQFYSLDISLLRIQFVINNFAFNLYDNLYGSYTLGGKKIKTKNSESDNFKYESYQDIFVQNY